MLLKATIGCLSPWEMRETYGSSLYANGKCQLGKLEVRIAERRLTQLAKANRP